MSEPSTDSRQDYPERSIAFVATRLGLFRRIGHVGNVPDIYQFECPGCGEWAYLDDDQWHGRVSVDHAADGCPGGYHETHDYVAAFRDGKVIVAISTAGGKDRPDPGGSVVTGGTTPTQPDLAALRARAERYRGTIDRNISVRPADVLAAFALVDTLQARVHALEVLWEHSACEIPCRCAECSAALSVSPAEKETTSE